MLRRMVQRCAFIGLVTLMLAGAGSTTAQEAPVTHIVQPGENLYRIALRYGVELNAIATANGVTNMSRIYVGQSLIIPGLSAPDASSDIVENPLIAGTPTTHIVQPGETLTHIAERYNLTVDQLIQINSLVNPNRIERGQALTVFTQESAIAAVAQPENAAPELLEGAPPTTAITVVVQPGEHLAQIAQRYGLTWPTLASANGISNPNQIYAGQTLVIPSPEEAANIQDQGILTPLVVGPGATVGEGKQIVVDLSDSRAYAYENGSLVYSALASTGLPATPTVVGDFSVYTKIRSQTMSGQGYYLPGVEWVMYFYQGYGLHGTYWHNNFGQPMSHGCVNLTNSDAQWFFQWAEVGTPVRVQY